MSRQRMLRTTLAVLWTISSAVGCSAVLDFGECGVNADCDPGYACSDEGYCVTASSLYSGPAVTNDICPFVVGPYGEDSTLTIGAILPLSGASDGLGLPMEQGITLAVEDFNSRGGIGPANHEVAVIFCDSKGEKERALDGAEHLLALGVSGVIGPALSDALIEVGAGVQQSKFLQISDGMVLVSPSATNPGLTKENDLVWRVVPSDALQARAIAEILRNPQIWGIPSTEKLAVVHKEGAYGQGLATQLSLELEAAIVPQVYPDPNEYLADQSLQEPCSLNGSCTDCQTGCCNECWFAPTYQWLGEELPDVVVLLGTEEVTGILAWLSAVWEKNNRPPIQWIVSEGGQVSGLFSEVAKYSTSFFGDAGVCGPECASVAYDILDRVRGTTPSGASGEVYSLFSSTFQSRFGYAETPTFAPFAYDATYLLLHGYSAALHANGGVLPTTDELIEGLGRLSEGEEVPNLPDSISSASLAFSNGEIGVNLEGASGPIDLNKNGEPDYGPVSIWEPIGESQTFKLTPVIDEQGILVESIFSE